MKSVASMPKYLVVDSSILIFYDRKGKLVDFLLEKKKENYKVIIPKAIAQEVIDEPKGVAEKIRETAPESANRILDSVARINNAIMQGFIRVETVNYRKYSKVMDNVRKHLSKLEAMPEYAIKKGDPELIALVIQLYGEVKEKVFVATLDKGLLKALKPFSDEVQYEVLDRTNTFNG
jgi:rRNA-processing protein FCF1